MHCTEPYTFLGVPSAPQAVAASMLATGLVYFLTGAAGFLVWGRGVCGDVLSNMSIDGVADILWGHVPLAMAFVTTVKARGGAAAGDVRTGEARSGGSRVARRLLHCADNTCACTFPALPAPRCPWRCH